MGSTSWLTRCCALAIATSLLDSLDLFAQYSAAAYCSANLNTTGTALACDVGNCPAVEAADTTILYSFDRLAIDPVNI